MKPSALRAWIEKRHLTHQEAADLLVMSRYALRERLYGRVPIGAQTERIIELLEALRQDDELLEALRQDDLAKYHSVA
jgi:hypothetical protein